MSPDAHAGTLDALKGADTALSECLEFVRRHSGSTFVAWQWAQQNHAQVRAAITSLEEKP